MTETWIVLWIRTSWTTLFDSVMERRRAIFEIMYVWYLRWKVELGSPTYSLQVRTHCLRRNKSKKKAIFALLNAQVQKTSTADPEDFQFQIGCLLSLWLAHVLNSSLPLFFASLTFFYITMPTFSTCLSTNMELKDHLGVQVAKEEYSS